MYAADTTVSTERSEAEIKSLLRRSGADQIGTAEAPGKAGIMFTMHNRSLRIVLPLPPRESFRAKMWGGKPSGGKYRDDQVLVRWEQACRQRWRALLLYIKAKLEAVERGIVEFEVAFLPHVVLPNGMTVEDCVRPGIKEAYDSGKVPPMLPDFSGGRA